MNKKIILPIVIGAFVGLCSPVFSQNESDVRIGEDCYLSKAVIEEQEKKKEGNLSNDNPDGNAEENYANLEEEENVYTDVFENDWYYKDVISSSME